MITITGDLLRFVITSLFLLIGMYTLVIMYIIDRLTGTRMYRRKTDYLFPGLNNNKKITQIEDEEREECEEEMENEEECGAEYNGVEYMSDFAKAFEERIKEIREEMDKTFIDKTPPAPIGDTEYVDGVPLVDIYDTQTSYDVDAGAEIISDVQEKLKYDKAYIQN